MMLKRLDCCLLKGIADIAGLARFWLGLGLWLAALTLWSTKCLPGKEQ